MHESSAVPDRPWRSYNRTYTALLVLIFTFLFLQVLYHPRDIGPDQAVQLQLARQLISGDTPYVDFVDTNPPFVVYLHTIPVVLSRFLAINVITTFSLGVLLLALWSVLAMKAAASESCDPVRVFAFDTAGLCVTGVTFALWVHRWQFGQREHLFILMYLPLFVTRWTRWEGGDVRAGRALAAGIVGGLGLCIKPHFLVIAVAPELYWLLSTRSFRKLITVETLSSASVVALYAGHWFIVPSDMRSDFFGELLPLMAARFHVLNSPYSELIARPSFQFALAMSLVPWVWKLGLGRGGGAGSRLSMRPVSIMTAAALFVYLLQHKWVPYRAIPAIYGGVLILAGATGPLLRRGNAVAAGTAGALFVGLWYLLLRDFESPTLYVAVAFGGAAFVQILAAELAGGPRVPRWIRAASLTPLVLCGGAIVGLVYWSDPGTYHPYPSFPALVDAVERYSSEGQSVLFLSTTGDGVQPTTLQTGRRYGSRYTWLFPVVLLYRGDDRLGVGQLPCRGASAMTPDERTFLAHLGHDIEMRKPAVVFVDVREPCPNCPPGFNLPDYFRCTGFLAQYMGHYRLTETIKDYEVYVRAAR